MSKFSSRLLAGATALGLAVTLVYGTASAESVVLSHG